MATIPSGTHRRAASLAMTMFLVLATAAIGAAANRASARGHGDAVRTVRRITIGAEGIQIDSARAGSGDAGGVVKIDHGTIEITADRDSHRVHRRVEVNGPVIAVDDGQSGLVRVFADAEVPAGERIEGDVVAVFGSVRVAGHVAGNVAAVFGSVKLEPGAVVDGDVVAVGGVLDQATGAIVNGESVSLGLFSWRPGIPTLQVLLLAVFLGWLMTVLLGGVLMLIFPRRLQRVAMTAASRTAGSFGLGVASAPLFVIAIVLLLITVVGIPFAVVLPLAYILSERAGQTATTYVLGCRLLRRPLGSGNAFVPLLAGTTFVALFFTLGAVLAGPQGSIRTLALFFTLLGALLTLGLSVVGTGAVLLSRFGSRPRESGSDAMSAIPPGAPAPPLPAVPASN